MITYLYNCKICGSFIISDQQSTANIADDIHCDEDRATESRQIVTASVSKKALNSEPVTE